MQFLATISRANSIGLRAFFVLLLLLVLSAGVYAIRNRKTFFDHKADSMDSAASANLRMWMIILVWVHAVVLTALMIYEV
ncbi:MAG: hypothetical protein H0X40_04820 [Chthoniobacterales bacterium]|nr:hypothetical protein [Chthoniobacterales bacterium]